ncbi:SUMO1 sentrin specific peptidase 8 [Homalodisca vitripennis]|nr:SUMO1 sentrin specific peptidase 8 [Homalodisca vitripennis]KAG8297687.1 SUMO1 sentrin specific peptidase 8 [Homalodisca vitripennis]
MDVLMKMPSVDLIVNNTRNLDDEMEMVVLSLLSELNRISVNFTDVNLSKILSALGALIKAYDEIADKRNSLKSINNELNCEVAFLKAKLDSEKESRINDLNDSFKTLDISQAEIEVLQGAVHSLNDKLKLSQLKSKNLEAENLSLSERIDDLDSQVSALKTKTDELTSCRDGLVNSLNNLRSKSNDWDKRRWLDDDNLKYFIDACDKSLVNRDDILIIDPSVTHLLKLSCMEDTESLLAQLSVNARTYIFACISDSTKGLTDDSASHWSLLLVDNVNKLSFHFDSSKCLNQVHAKTLSVKLGVCESKFVEMPCAQQRNDFECGINLIVNLKFILNFYVIPKESDTLPHIYDLREKSLFLGIKLLFMNTTLNIMGSGFTMHYRGSSSQRIISILSETGKQLTSWLVCGLVMMGREEMVHNSKPRPYPGGVQKG